LIARGVRSAGHRIFNDFFNDFRSRQLSGARTAHTRPLPGCERRPERHILTNMKVDMTQRYRKFKRAWGTYYAYDNFTGNSVSLKTRDKAEATQKVNAMNETERQPSISLGLARVYLNATDPQASQHNSPESSLRLLVCSDRLRQRLQNLIAQTHPLRHRLGDTCNPWFLCPRISFSHDPAITNNPPRPQLF